MYSKSIASPITLGGGVKGGKVKPNTLLRNVLARARNDIVMKPSIETPVLRMGSGSSVDGFEKKYYFISLHSL